VLVLSRSYLSASSSITVCLCDFVNFLRIFLVAVLVDIVAVMCCWSPVAYKWIFVLKATISGTWPNCSEQYWSVKQKSKIIVVVSGGIETKRYFEFGWARTICRYCWSLMFWSCHSTSIILLAVLPETCQVEEIHGIVLVCWDIHGGGLTSK